MSKKTEVMSHDPLADLAAEIAPDTTGGTVHVEPEPERVTLPASLTVADVAEVQEMLCGHLDLTDVVVLDGADVESIDGAGLQLLAVFQKAAMQKQLAVEWHAASDGLCAAAHQIGLADLLGLTDHRAV